MQRAPLSLLLATSILAACGDDTQSPSDTSLSPDLGADAGAKPDAVADASVEADASSDLGPTDTGRIDMAVADMDGGRPDSGTMDPLEIVGVWASNFGSEEVITEARFNQAFIRNYDNATNVLITQNSTSAEFNPGLFNRIVWTDLSDDRFYYCFVDFGLPTLDAALASTMTADATDPEMGGCGMFPWTRLRRSISVRGRYLSNFGMMETITATAWDQGFGPMSVVDWDETSGWVVTRNAADAEFNPNLFNRIDITAPAMNGSFYYCFVDFGLLTAAEALASTNAADRSDPENAGCGMFPWTRLDLR